MVLIDGSKLENLKKDCTARFEDLEKANQESKIQVANLQTMIEKLVQSKSEGPNEILTQENEALKAENKKLMDQIEQLKTQVEVELAAEVSGLKSKKLELQEELEAQKQANLGYKTQMENLENDRKFLVASLSQAERNLKAVTNFDLPVENKDLKILSEAQGKTVPKVSSGKSLCAKVDPNEILAIQIKALKPQFDALKESVEKLQAEPEAQKQAQTGPEVQTVQNLQNELEAHKTHQSQCWRLFGEVMKQMKKENIDMRNEIKELKEKVEKPQQLTTPPIQEEQIKLKLAEIAAEKDRKQIENLKKKLAAITKKLAEKDEQLADKKREIRDLMQKIREKDEVINGMEKEETLGFEIFE